MKRPFLTIIAILLLVSACAPQPEAAGALDLESTGTPFPMEGGAFTGAPQDFVLREDELGGLYAAADAGAESPNNAVLENRPDGEAYLEATGRLNGWRIQFNGIAEGQVPAYVFNAVNVYESAEGAQLVLSREWHADVWSLIDSGQLTQLPEITGLDGADQLVWQSADGAVGVELIYRNLYIYFSSPGDGGDPGVFLAELARAHLDWIKAGEQ